MAAEPVGDLDFYRLIRARLEHEDVLIVNRLAWLMASQSFLFTAYAIVVNGIAGNVPSSIAQHMERLIRLIPLVGVAASVLIFSGIFAATRAMKWLKGRLHERIPDETVLGLPPIQTPAPIAAHGLAAPLLLPLVFVGVWLYLLFTFIR